MDILKRVFKTFSDPTRVRVLALLEREELAVQELMDVLGMAQSRVSRHLAILRDAGLLEDRRDGTYVFYRFAVPEEGPWRDAWNLVVRALADDPTRERDFFDAVGPEWDALRKVFDDEALRGRAIARLVDPRLVVADIGTGTGILAAELARLGLRVVAVDHSTRMLDAARAKLEALSQEGVELRQGDAADLPLQDREVDAAFAHRVLHYLPSPGDAIREMARVVVPGGVVVVVDFVRHEHDWMRNELGVHWLGFEAEEVADWFLAAGLPAPDHEVHADVGAGRDLPASFIASARKPG
jgi:ArsR family transcriptional regulator